MMVENYTRKVEGFEKHAENLLLNQVSIKEYLIKQYWTEADMTGEWVIDEYGQHMFGNILDNELKYTTGVCISPGSRWIESSVWIGLFDDNGEGGEI